MQRFIQLLCQPDKIVLMKNCFLFCVMFWMAMFFSCSKKAFENSALAGKWVLTKICVCNSCTDTITTNENETLVFSLNGQVDLFGAVGDTQRHYSGTYIVTQQSYGKILNINLNAPDSVKNFLFVPGSIISSQTTTQLVLELATPFSNPCAYKNTYTAEPE